MNLNSFLAPKKLFSKDKDSSSKHNSLERNSSEKSLGKSLVLNNKLKSHQHQQSQSNKNNNNGNNLTGLVKTISHPQKNYKRINNNQSKLQHRDQVQKKQQSNPRTLKKTYSKQYITVTDQEEVQQQQKNGKKSVDHDYPLPFFKKMSNSNIYSSQNNHHQQTNIENQQDINHSYRRRNGSQWTEMSNPTTSSSSNFNSSRLESKNCLQQLSRKTINELNTLQSKIQAYNKKTKQILQKQYQKLKQTVIASIQKMFEYYEQNMRVSIDKQITKINAQIYQNKYQLELIYTHLEKMKEGIESKNWRKIAAQILSSQLEKEVQAALSKIHRSSNLINVGFQADRKRVQYFQEALEELVKFKIIPIPTSSFPTSSVIQTQKKYNR